MRFTRWKPLIRERIAKAGGPVTLSALGISRQAAVYGFQHMTDGRPRVTIAHLIKELQLEESIYPFRFRVYSLTRNLDQVIRNFVPRKIGFPGAAVLFRQRFFYMLHPAAPGAKPRTNGLPHYPAK